jgi:DNA modification methylase
MIRLIEGDCIAAMREMAERGETVHAVVCDPPYHLTSVVKRFGGEGAASAQFGTDGAFARASAGFMGKKWDGGDIAFRPETWRLAYDLLPPGGYLVAFGGTRTFHRMAVAIEDAGFELRDTLFYLYGTGFPKSHNLDRLRGDAICGCPASHDSMRRVCEAADTPGCLGAKGEAADLLAPVQRGAARSGVGDARAQGQGGAKDAIPAEVRSGQPGLEGRRDAPEAARQLRVGALREVPAGSDLHGADGRLCDGAPSGYGPVGRPLADADGGGAPPRPQSAEQRPRQPGTVAVQPEPQTGGAWPLCPGCGKPVVPRGLGTALKPAVEPIILARKPLAGTVAANVLAHRTGALNVDGCRVGDEVRVAAYTSLAPCHGNALGAAGTAEARRGTQGEPKTYTGRWPANVLHDGSDEVEAAFAAFGSDKGALAPVHTRGADKFRNAYGSFKGDIDEAGSTFRGDTGTASRFFYSAKATAADRAGSKHPTVKPVALMRWLVRLVCPPGGVVLDPFAGSGTTGAAAMAEGMGAVLVEAEPEYQADIRRRLGLAAPARSEASSFALDLL